MVKQEDIVAKSVEIEILGDIERCHEGEYSKFYCLKVKIKFDNGEEREFLMRSHESPKSLENFINNKKGIKERTEKSFVLLRNGEIMYVYEQ